MTRASDLTLVVMAAGLSTRYGRLKQLDELGPSGEALFDYAVFDAMRCGYARVVIVIRDVMADAFKAHATRRCWPQGNIVWACQRVDDLPEGRSAPGARHKPWGTLHALLSARAHLSGPFVVVNADDFYGQDALQSLAHHLSNDSQQGCAMVAYPLSHTLSVHGGVNRGLCLVSNGCLNSIHELTDIVSHDDGSCHAKDASGKPVSLAANVLVSMNIWGFGSAWLAPLQEAFGAFLLRHGGDLDTECFIPWAVDQIIQGSQASVRVFASSERWVGLTHSSDRDACVAKLAALHSEGRYPTPLWPTGEPRRP